MVGPNVTFCRKVWLNWQKKTESQLHFKTDQINCCFLDKITAFLLHIKLCLFSKSFNRKDFARNHTFAIFFSWVPVLLSKRLRILDSDLYVIGYGVGKIILKLLPVWIFGQGNWRAGNSMKRQTHLSCFEFPHSWHSLFN